MSIFSGKCDVFDWFYDKDDGYIKKCKFYTANDYLVPLRIDSHHDLAPYYPYIVVMGGGDSEGRVIHLSTESFIDIEEREHLEWKLREFKKYWRKCKKLKKPYVEEEALKHVCSFAPSKSDKMIARRVREDGNKTIIYGIHDDTHNHYRKILYDKMIELGWNKRYAKWWIWKDIKYLFEGDSDESGTD